MKLPGFIHTGISANKSNAESWNSYWTKRKAYEAGSFDFVNGVWTDLTGHNQGILKKSYCLSFEGSYGGSVNTGKTFAAIKNAPPITLMCRVKSDDVTQAQIIFREREGGGSGITMGSSVMNCRFTDGTHTDTTASLPVQNNTWYHYAITNDGSYIIQYLNGIAIGAPLAVTATTFGGSYNNVYLGYTGSKIRGDVCDYRVYSDVKTPAQILSYAKGLYDWTNLIYALPCAEGFENDVTGNYKLYEPVGGTYLDIATDTDTAWATQDIFHFNIQCGFTECYTENTGNEKILIRVPYNNGVKHTTPYYSVKTERPAKASGHNGAETVIDVNGVEYSYQEMLFDSGHIQFADINADYDYQKLTITDGVEPKYLQLRDELNYDTIMQYVYGKENIATFRNAIKTYTAGLIKTANIGDSLSPSKFWSFYKMGLYYTDFGGAGMQSVQSNPVLQAVEKTNPGMITYSISLHWTIKSASTATNAKERGIMTGSASTNNAAATMSFLVSFFKSTNIKVWFYRNVGQGTFTYQIDGAAGVVVDTAGAEGLSSVNIPGLSDAVHTIAINTINGDVTIYGISFEKAAGIFPLWLNCDGSKIVEWDDASYLSDFLAVETPNLVTICLGANDATTLSKADYKAALKVLIDDVKNNSDAEILILTPNDRNPVDAAGYVAKMAVFRSAILELVTEESIAFFDLNLAWYTYAQAVALGLLFDDIHPNDDGWESQGNMIYKAIMQD